MLYAAIVVAVLAGLFVASLAVRSAMATRPVDLGLVDGRLRPCPASPNCVSTQADNGEHRIEPLLFEGTGEEALAKLRRVIESMPRARIITDEGGYLHAEFTTLVFRFVDDVELVVDPDAKRIDFCSASRVGYSDLGTNRRRMEAIRAAFAKLD